MELLLEKEEPSILIKILLLRGKIEESVILCDKFGLQKWKFLLNEDQNFEYHLKNEANISHHDEILTELLNVSEIFQISSNHIHSATDYFLDKIYENLSSQKLLGEFELRIEIDAIPVSGRGT